MARSSRGARVQRLLTGDFLAECTNLFSQSEFKGPEAFNSRSDSVPSLFSGLPVQFDCAPCHDRTSCARHSALSVRLCGKLGASPRRRLAAASERHAASEGNICCNLPGPYQQGQAHLPTLNVLLYRHGRGNAAASLRYD